MKTIFITGASSGFGKLAVEELLTAGHRVVATVRGGRDRAATLFPAWIDKPGLRVMDLDLSQFDRLEDSLREIDRLSEGRIDVLINNAGFGLFGMSEDVSTSELRHQFDVNFFAPHRLTQLLLPRLIESRGKVINITSVVGFMTFPMYSAYCASKYALESLTESLYYELKPHGVQVAAIEPGGFKTDFASRSRIVAKWAMEKDSRNHAPTSAFFRFMDERSHGLGNPRKVSRLIVQLCEKDRIKLRYPIGLDAWAALVMKRLLPDQLRVRLIEWTFRKFIFR